MKLIGSGIGISGGALSGSLAFDMDDIETIRKKDPEEKIILVRPDTVPDDIPLIFNCDGLITAKGGSDLPRSRYGCQSGQGVHRKLQESFRRRRGKKVLSKRRALQHRGSYLYRRESGLYLRGSPRDQNRLKAT